MLLPLGSVVDFVERVERALNEVVAQTKRVPDFVRDRLAQTLLDHLFALFFESLLIFFARFIGVGFLLRLLRFFFLSLSGFFRLLSFFRSLGGGFFFFLGYLRLDFSELLSSLVGDAFRDFRRFLRFFDFLR